MPAGLKVGSDLPYCFPPQTSRTRQEAGQLRMPACLCYSGLFRPCLAMPCLPASALTPCLLALVCICPCVHPSPCAPGSSRKLRGLPCRQPRRPLCLLASVPIQCSAGTALQAAAHGDCIGAARAPFVFTAQLRSFQGGGLGLHWAAGHLLC